MALIIRSVSTPHVAFLGRIPGTRRYSDFARHPDNEPTPGLLLLRIESGIVYFNEEHIFDTVLAHLNTMPEPPRMVICDLSTSSRIDMAAARMFLNLHAELAKRGIALRLVETRSSVRDMLRAEGAGEKFGPVDRFTSLVQTIDEFQNSPGSGHEFPPPRARIAAPGITFDPSYFKSRIRLTYQPASHLSMEHDIFDMDHLHEERRKAIAASLCRTTVEELQTLGMELFPIADHPWYDEYFTFLRENGTATFYFATTHDRFHIIYCHDRNRGMWFIPNCGMGPLRERGLHALKDIVEGHA